ncbi:hypothetical protein [Salinibacter altiplanensis]|uniref:hypothetical protein n=1 Tax=Salinibacter altiplanensis TaxID=1803181 RepID=UPI000C9FAF5A|nr:hypothetical protein [Salinibacter altiplanensis]
MRPDRSEEELDLLQQEANRAKVRELEDALEDSDPPSYQDLEQEVERLRGLLNSFLDAQTRLRTVDEDDSEAWANALDRMINLRKEADNILDRGGGGDG